MPDAGRGMILLKVSVALLPSLAFVHSIIRE